jgi:hypothetical protein
MKSFQFKKIVRLFFVCSILGVLLNTSFYSTSLQGNQNSGVENSSFSIEVPDWYEKPHNYSELVSWYKQLESLFPGYVNVFKANEVYQTGMVDGGYDLYYVRITNENLGFHKPEVLFLGSPHGDETVGTIGLYWFSHWFLRKTCTDEPCQEYSKEWLRWILDNRDLYRNFTESIWI